MNYCGGDGDDDKGDSDRKMEEDGLQAAFQ